MLTSKRLTDLRAGVATVAAGVKDSTVRAWRLNNGLKLGLTSGEGEQRRYDLADVSRLLLMRYLTDEFTLSATGAAFLVNYAHSRIALLTHQELYAIDHGEAYPGDPASIMFATRADGTIAPTFYTPKDLAGIERPAVGLELRIDLKAIVCDARDRLTLATGGFHGNLEPVE